MELKNTETNQVIEAIGCWPQPGNVVAFVDGQGHALLDWDSPIGFSEPCAVTYDDVARATFAFYDLPSPWEVAN